MFSQKFQQMMMKFDSDMMVNAVGLMISRLIFILFRVLFFMYFRSRIRYLFSSNIGVDYEVDVHVNVYEPKANLEL